MGTRKITPEEFRDGLLAIAAESHDTDEGGDVVTKASALQRRLWQLALGWTEESRDDRGNIRRVTNKPQAWALEFLFANLIGKPTTMEPAKATGGMKAADKVRVLAAARLNAIAKKAVGPPAHRAKGAVTKNPRTADPDADSDSSEG